MSKAKAAEQEGPSRSGGRTQSFVIASLSLLLLTACPSATLLPDEQRVTLTRDFEGRTMYLRNSVFVMPFFSDADAHLVSVYPPDSVHLLNDTEGKPILPGRSQGILELGTK